MLLAQGNGCAFLQGAQRLHCDQSPCSAVLLLEEEGPLLLLPRATLVPLSLFPAPLSHGSLGPGCPSEPTTVSCPRGASGTGAHPWRGGCVHFRSSKEHTQGVGVGWEWGGHGGLDPGLLQGDSSGPS